MYRGEDSLHLSVWDRDFLSSDDPLGCLSVETERFWQGLSLVQQLQFENPSEDGERCGWLYASITAYASLEKAKEAKEAAHIIQTSSIWVRFENSRYCLLMNSLDTALDFHDESRSPKKLQTLHL